MPPPFRRRLFGLISAAIVAIVGPARTFAWQPDEQPDKPEAKKTARSSTGEALIAVHRDAPISLSFKGGTAAEYIATLRGAVKPRPLNVVFRGKADGVKLPPVELANVSVGTAVQTLDQIHEPIGDGVWLEIKRVIDGGGEPLYAILLRSNEPLQPFAAQSTDVFSIRGITEPAPTDPDGVQVSLPSSVVLSALEAILSVDTAKEAPAPVLKYHPDSGLVVVRAFEDQLLLVRRAIGTMQDDADRRRAMYATIDLGAVQVELQRSSIKLQGAVDRMNVAEQEYERIRKQVAEGQIPQQEEINAAAQVRTLEREAEIARLETAALQKRFGRIQKLQDSVSDDKATK